MRALIVATTLVSLLAVLASSTWQAQVTGRETPAQVAADARMLRFPDVSATQLCFVYAGDIWLAPKEGGEAHRLTSAPGEEFKPRFSPDGTKIAFSANYDGNTDVYVIPVEGGVVQRVTHHPSADLMIDWTPDGKELLFSSTMAVAPGRPAELYTVSEQGGLPRKLPVPWGDNGSFSPDGKSIAYTPWSVDFRTWKRYRGGMASRIWIFDLKTGEAEEVSQGKANYGNPMWVGSTIYHLCDGDGRGNICAYDTKSRKHTQITHFKDFDVRFPSLGPAEIVFELGAAVHLLDLKTHKTREVSINVLTDGATLRPKVVNVSRAAGNGAISPSGERAAFEARGEVFTVPAEHGVTRNLTRSSGVAERYPAWSPDGKHIAYCSDKSGEYELYMQPAEGGAETQLTKLGAGFKYAPQWSPDAQKIVFIDKAMRIHLHDLVSGKTKEIDRDLWLYHGDLEDFRVSWSADSRWIAYSRGQENSNGAVCLYDTAAGTVHKVTSAYYNDMSPAFDPDGKYLFFASGRDFNPIYSDIDPTWIYANSVQLFAVPLRNDVKSPLATRNNDEPVKEEKRPEEKREEKPKVKPVEIDLEGFERRAVKLAVPSGNYTSLQAVEGKLLYLRRSRTGSSERTSQVVSYSLEDREERVLEENAGNFVVAANRKKMLVESRGAFTIKTIGGFGGFGGGRGMRGGSGGQMPEDDPTRRDRLTLDLSSMQATVDPAAEWRQIFVDAWRLQRDYFYDPAMHGVDWAGMRARYGALMEKCVSRWDLNFVIGEMISEINASHTYRGGGDEEAPRQLNVGLLGCDYALVDGRYQISKILDGAPWDSEVRSPLNEPGLNIKAGTFLLAVNGVELDTREDPWAAFQGLGDKVVALTLNSKATLEGARTVCVTTLSSESRLRYLSTVEETRQRVERLSDGKIGYVFVPNTGRQGQTELVRQLRAQYTKQAMIIDERWNGGGQLPDRFVELLNRPSLCYWGVRDGKDWQTPMFAHFGPKAMLINGRAGSGGDAFPHFFKQQGCGKLIGTRTWGGLIGITGVPGLIDGGSVTVPTFGIYNTSGEWIIEGYGVDPDIEVVAHPAKVTKGEDPEVDRAVTELIGELKTNPPKAPPKPAYPDRSK